MKAKANVNPTIEDSTKPVAIRAYGRPNTATTERTVRLGSMSVKRVLLAKLVLDIENIARARGGITANSPSMTAKSGKMNLRSKIATNEENKKINTQVAVVKSESARHLLR